MKITVIGGGGVRTPLLVNGLAQSELPIDEVALFDVDADRLAAIASLAKSFFAGVRAYADPAAAVSGASFVFLSIRPGGIAARARDEAIAVAHGVVGQETVGPAGFAMAMRTIPPAVEYARLVQRVAPAAWLVSFTNPVGVVSQAIHAASRVRAIGICDTPTELFEDAAHAIGVESSRCTFDYFGLNHLGWLREIVSDGTPQLTRLWDDDERLASVYHAPLFEPAFLRSLRLLPTEYLFYYYRPQLALENLRRAGQTRGAAVAALNDRLFRDLASAGAHTHDVYERYLAERGGGYLQLESGSASPLPPSPWAALTGYDKIALSVVRAIHFDTGDVIPLNVPNGETMADLERDDVVEVPCVVDRHGARPCRVAPVPLQVRDLIVRVKAYERLTVRAAATRAHADAVAALAANPLVGERALAEHLTAALEMTEGTERTGPQRRNGEAERQR